jgi:predicted Zn-dependent protease
MKRCLILTVAVGLLFCACVTTGPGGAKSFIIIPTSQEVAIGQGMAEQLSQTEKSLPDSAWQAYLNQVGQKIVAVCDRKDLQYRFTVVQDDQVNAFASPGGYVYFYTGLLRQMDNEAELAAVMAHEISHVVGRHGIKRLQMVLGVSLAYELAAGDKNSKALETAVGVGMNLVSAQYSRDDERQADDYGMTYMIRAGYDPNGMVTMFNKLAALGGSGSADVFEKMLASHPDTQDRIAYAKTRISSMQPMPSHLTLETAKYQQMRSRLPAKK